MGESSAEEANAVNKLIATDEEYRRYFQQFKTIWEASLNLAVRSAADENAAWQHFKSRITYQQQNPKPVNKFRWMKVAASALVLIGIGIISFLVFNYQGAPREIALQSLQQVVIDTLPDASVVTLNKNSTLTYPERFVGGTRPVSLKGEAFFLITANIKKPFVITVNDLQVKVVGTSFNIKSMNAATEIVVETGIVQVNKNGQVITLKAGEKIMVLKEQAALMKETVKDKLYNYYRTKEFVCDNTPLWKLVAVLNEAYGSNIMISNEATKNMMITTTFYNQPLDVVLNVIHETLGITVVKKDNSIILQ